MTSRSLACVLFCLTSCSASHTATPDAGTDGAVDAPGIDAGSADACTVSANIRCTKLQSCSPADLSKRFGDVATCEARQLLICQEALAAPATGNTAASVLTCVEAIQAESCTDFFVKAPPAVCTTQVGPGSGSAACGFPAQCATGFCDDGADALCGTCAPQPAVGDSCAIATCGQDLVCVASTKLCQAPVAADGACNAGLPCADGFTCVGAVAVSSTNGTCISEVAAVGSACDPKHKTLADCSADDGLTCDTVTTECVTQPMVAAGQPCGAITGVKTACTGAATCVIPAAATVGTCVAPAADGSACDTAAAGPTCLTPAKCVPTSGSGSDTAGTCELPGSQTCS